MLLSSDKWATVTKGIGLRLRIMGIDARSCDLSRDVGHVGRPGQIQCGRVGAVVIMLVKNRLSITVWRVGGTIAGRGRGSRHGAACPRGRKR